MRHITLILLFPLCLSAQVDTLAREQLDVFRQDLTSLESFRRTAEQRLNTIQLNLRAHHKQFKAGVGMTVAGWLLSMASAPLMARDQTLGVTLLGIGGAVAIGGTITIWRSHRHIGNAGRQ